MFLLLLACSGTDPVIEAPPPPPPPPSHRETHQSWRSLTHEVWRAELSVGGLLVDMGDPDQHKYTRGGWGNEWSGMGAEGPLTYAEAGKKRAWLHVVTDAPTTALVFNARSDVEGQTVTARVDDQVVGTADVSGTWGAVTLNLETPIEPGRHRVHLDFGKKGDVRAQVDSVWFQTDAAATAPTATPRVEGTALNAPSDRTYAYHLVPPTDAALVFVPAGAATFVVEAQSDTTGPTELWRGGAADVDAAGEVVVDLADFAGAATRLTLRTEGGAGTWDAPGLYVPEIVTPERVDTAPKNVMVILIDTVRADVFEPWKTPAADGDPLLGHADTVSTPTVDKLAAEGVVFRQAYSNENWTKPSVATVLSGLRPVTHDTKMQGSVLSKDVTLLSERMKEQGFSTAMFSANGFVSDRFGFDQGWDHYTNYIREGKASYAEKVFREAGDWIETHQDERSLVYIQTIDPHVPYSVDVEYIEPYHPEKYTGSLSRVLDGHVQADISQGKRAVTDADKKWIRSLYYAEISYHDHHLAEFLARLDELGWLDDTLIVITNDHGEELGEHGRYGHGHSLYDELLRAPLILHDPSRLEAQVIHDVVEQVDLTPTLLDLMQVPADGMDGISMVPLLDGQPALRPGYAVSEFLNGKRAIRVGEHKLEVDKGKGVNLWNVHSDPLEQTNVAADEPIAYRMCEVYLGEALASPDKEGIGYGAAAQGQQFEAGEIPIEGELQEQLEALGYFGD